MKYMIVKSDEVVSIHKYKDLQAALARAKNEVEELKAELIAIKTRDCVVGPQCAFCENAGTPKMIQDERYHFVIGGKPTCLLKQPCTHFAKKGGPMPQEGGNSHD